MLEEQLKGGMPYQQILCTVSELKMPCATGINVLTELLDFEKMSSGLQKLDRSIQDPNEFIELTVTPFKMVAQQKGVTLECQNYIGRNSVTLNIDEAKVNIIISIVD